jgi:hypothetical protein
MTLPLIGGLCPARQTLTTKGLKDLPLVGGLRLVQRTPTTEGLRNLPLVGGLCLAQQTLPTKVSKNNSNEPQRQMTQPVTDGAWEHCDNSRTANNRSNAERWDGCNAASQYLPSKIVLGWMLVHATMTE